MQTNCTLPKPFMGLLLLVAIFAPNARCEAQKAATGSTIHPLKSFDVSSIHLNTRNDGRWRMNFSNDGYLAMGVSAKQLIQDAFGIYEESRLLGLSGWEVKDRFDVQAKVDPSKISQFEAFSVDERRSLLQEFMKERFQLVSHHEVREKMGYVLVQSKKGVAMTQTSSANPELVSQGNASFSESRHGHWRAEHCTPDQLAHLLSMERSMPVRNETGLSKDYAFNLEWDPDYEKPEGQAQSGSSTNSYKGVSLFVALREQLGLELKAQKIPVDILVVDSLQYPSQN